MSVHEFNVLSLGTFAIRNIFELWLEIKMVDIACENRPIENRLNIDAIIIILKLFHNNWTRKIEIIKRKE